MFNVNFSNVTPAPEPVKVVVKPFNERFVEEMEKEPRFTYMSFRQEDDYLSLKVTFVHRSENGEKNVVYIDEMATPELIEAILSAFCMDFSKIKEYESSAYEPIMVDDDDEDLRLEMFKQFLGSPYKIIPKPAWHDNDGNAYFCRDFQIHMHNFVSFCLPDFQEMVKICHEYKDAKKQEEQVEL